MKNLLYSGHHYDEADRDLQFRVFYYNCGVGFLALATFIMGFVRIQQNTLIGIIEFTFSALFFLLLILLRLKKSWAERIIAVGIFMAFVIFYLLYLAVPNVTIFAVFFSLLGAVIFLQGKKSGTYWLLIILAAMVIGHQSGIMKAGYSHTDLVTICLYYIGLFIILFAYDKVKNEQSEELKQLNENLELKVKERTEELRLLNETLAQRVESEVQARMEIEYQREEQEKLLIQQSKMAMMGEMIGAIAHQWNQPLTAIGLMAQEMQEMYDYGEMNSGNIKRLKGDILNQVHFMDQTIKDFRSFFKPSKERSLFNMVEAIQVIEEILMPELKLLEIRVVIEGDRTVEAFGYPNEFKQVMLNIINNAKDALKENERQGEIRVKIESTEEMVTVTVSDNAGGIPDSLLPDKLFEPYVTTKGEEGTGIGLNMSKTIIEGNMNGKLDAKNIPGGAEFTISLPRH